MARRPRRRRNPATPEGTVLSLAALGGMMASMYYAATAMTNFSSPDESKKRALMAGGVLLGSVALMAVVGPMAGRRAVA